MKAIAGIGSTNVIRVPVDLKARLDCQALDTLLAEYLKHRRAVYAIAVVIGATEHGSVDPLSKVVALRRKYQQHGLSFLIHADAAWGGYFTSMLVPNPGLTGSSCRLDDPTLFVNAHTVNELRHLRQVDSITLDPHKSGYTPFPAGALCYQDGRLRHMVTWNSPVVGFENVSLKMGSYGVEGRYVPVPYDAPRLLIAGVSFLSANQVQHQWLRGLATKSLAFTAMALVTF